MSLRGIKLVTFDATNTLLKFRKPPWQYYADVGRDYGFKGTGDDIKDRLLDSFNVNWKNYPNFGKNVMSWEDWWRNVVKSTFDGHLPPSTDINGIATRLIQEFRTPKCWNAAKGGDKLIALLSKNGISLGVISNFDPRLNDILQSFNFDVCFDFIVTSYEVGLSKPDHRIFHYVLEKFQKNVRPAESLHIGDDVEKDYEAARAAGWHAILVTSKINTEKPPAPGHVFNSLEELSLAIEQKKLKL